MRPRFALSAAAPLALLAALAGCTSSDPDPEPPRRDQVLPAGAFKLVAFDTCAEALKDMKSAAKQYVGPWGFGGWGGRDGGIPLQAADAARAGAENAGGASSANKAAVPDYSGTNTHEAGVDEPDIVKTDGQRIVTVSRGVLHVVDAASRKVTGELDLASGTDDPRRWGTMSLLLHGDRALVLVHEGWSYGAADIARSDVAKPVGPAETTGPELLLVELGGKPRVVSRYTIEGGLVDARQTGSIARVVVRSAPRLSFPYKEGASEAQHIATNRGVIDRADEAAWLPDYTITTGGKTTRGRVECGQMSRPETYSGTSMVTVLSFDLGASDGLGNGDPVGVVADGDTVYSNGINLYVANDQRWRVMPWLESRNDAPKAEDEITEIYQFDASKPGKPRYVTSASVRGWLINQYAMSEWDGHLRVATTSGRTWGENPKSTSTVYVLKATGGELKETGRVAGLGKGERIYAVRFAGTTGYVVTFRQTDPLYTVDLTDPAKPRVAGELKITGYSAYLHPTEPGRVIGIGQEASTEGRVQGTQVSLFDVSNLDQPARLSQYHVANSSSEAEYDPHAFLYWAKDRLLVVPLMGYDRNKGTSQMNALVLRVGESGFTELSRLSHRGAPDTGMIRRSLVVGDTLWTVSDAGLMATGTSTMDTRAWLKWDA
jgi:Beta propeller domain